MLKVRLRPNRYVLAENYVQVVSRNAEYRQIALDWLAGNVEGRPLRTSALLKREGKSDIEAIAFYGQNSPVLKGKIEVVEPQFLGVMFGTERIVEEYAGQQDAVLQVYHVSNDKSVIAIIPTQPNFGCVWFVQKPGTEPRIVPNIKTLDLVQA